MPNGELLSVPDFCRNNGISRTQLYYLEKIRRAPSMMRVGGRVLISPEAELAWRHDMEARPIEGSVRRAAEQVITDARAA